MSRISIIIPAYNAARTIERTVKSALASTIPVEVWVVDDGSTDSTAEILDRLNSSTLQPSNSPTLQPFNSSTLQPSNSPTLQPSNPSTLQPFNLSTLHIIHQPNAGAYQARINGLKAVRTPYFGFVDADDEIEPQMFEKMLRRLESEDLDVVQCLSDKDPQTFRSRDEYVLSALLKGSCASYVWDKLYKNQFDFESFEPTNRLTNFDDLLLNWQFFRKIRKMGFVNEPLYHYNVVANSAVHHFRWNKVRDYLGCLRIRRKLAATYGLRPWGLYNLRWMVKNARNLLAFALSCLIRRWR